MWVVGCVCVNGLSNIMSDLSVAPCTDSETILEDCRSMIVGHKIYIAVSSGHSSMPANSVTQIDLRSPGLHSVSRVERSNTVRTRFCAYANLILRIHSISLQNWRQ